MDINKLIFSRTAPKKKIEIVENLHELELLSVIPATSLKMVKMAGTRLYKSIEKRIVLTKPVSNDWNAEFISVRTYRGKLIAEVYVQFDNTDTTVGVPFTDFLISGDYRGSVTREDRDGNPQTHYFTFTESKKAECVKTLLLEYLHIYYKEQLSEN